MTEQNVAFYKVGMQASKHIAAFYHFALICEAASLVNPIEKEGQSRNLRGLIILAGEGVNGTISGTTREEVVSFLAWLTERLAIPPLEAKWSVATAWPFHKFRVRPRKEIVTLGKPEVRPLAPKSATHLSPEAWDQALREEDVCVLDTRNWYETRIGKFAGAIDPNLTEFHEFGEYLTKAELPKNKKYLIYCTGGIRCEKALVEMRDQGFEDVYQLDGGILNYLEKYPERAFEGECFVFDNRVAVDQSLKPTTQYTLCPHCGQPADQKMACSRCNTETLVCIRCAEHSETRTCSKNCAHHARLTPGKKGRSQMQGLRFSKV